MWFVCRFKVADLSDVTHNAIHTMGLTKSIIVDPYNTDFVGLAYDRAKNTTNFVFITRKDSVETVTNS
jgi:hypothetical protein